MSTPTVPDPSVVHLRCLEFPDGVTLRPEAIELADVMGYPLKEWVLVADEAATFRRVRIPLREIHDWRIDGERAWVRALFVAATPEPA